MPKVCGGVCNKYKFVCQISKGGVVPINGCVTCTLEEEAMLAKLVVVWQLFAN